MIVKKRGFLRSDLNLYLNNDKLMNTIKIKNTILVLKKNCVKLDKNHL